MPSGKSQCRGQVFDTVMKLIYEVESIYPASVAIFFLNPAIRSVGIGGVEGSQAVTRRRSSSHWTKGTARVALATPSFYVSRGFPGTEAGGIRQGNAGRDGLRVRTHRLRLDPLAKTSAANNGFLGWRLARFARSADQDRPKFPVASFLPVRRSDRSRSSLRSAVALGPPSGLSGRLCRQFHSRSRLATENFDSISSANLFGKGSTKQRQSRTDRPEAASKNIFPLFRMERGVATGISTEASGLKNEFKSF